MKELQCYNCEEVFEAESREKILKQLYDHYMKNHNEIITGASEKEKKAWMTQFEKGWAMAKEK